LFSNLLRQFEDPRWAALAGKPDLLIRRAWAASAF